jgi:hypothetical protein
MYKQLKCKLQVQHFRTDSPGHLRSYAVTVFPRIGKYFVPKDQALELYEQVGTLYVSVMVSRFNTFVTDPKLRVAIEEIGAECGANNETEYVEARDEFMLYLNNLLHIWNDKHAVLEAAGIEIK